MSGKNLKSTLSRIGKQAGWVQGTTVDQMSI